MASTTMKPGVVTGERYRDFVAAAKEGGYALPAVNVTSTSTLNCALEAAANTKSDIIIQLSNGGAQFYAGKAIQDSFQAKVLGAVSAARHIHMLAEHYGVCVVIHTDHANRELIPWVEALIEQGEAFHAETGGPLYSSHMLDLSADDIEFNLSECERLLARMAKIDMSIEIELGVTGGEEDGVGVDIDESADNSKLYTQPEDVLVVLQNDIRDGAEEDGRELRQHRLVNVVHPDGLLDFVAQRTCGGEGLTAQTAEGSVDLGYKGPRERLLHATHDDGRDGLVVAADVEEQVAAVQAQLKL